MPDASIFDSLPGLDAVQPAVNALPVDLSLPRVDLPLADLQALPAAAPTADAVPDLAGAPSPGGFRRALEEPLGGLAALDGQALVASARGPIPVEIPKPGFDVNGVAGQITAQVLPAGAGRAVNVDVPLPAALGDFTGPLRRLSEAGAATPLRLLHVLLTVLDRLVETATDADRLREYTVEALGEILVAQCGTLRDALPGDALERARLALDGGFLDRYERVLADLARVQAASGPEMLTAVRGARELVQPLQQFGRTGITLDRLRAGDTEPLARALSGVADFATAEEVFLQPVFDSVQARVGAVLDAVAAPVRQLIEMIERIQQFLEEAAGQAEGAARAVSEKLSATLRGVGRHLETAQERIDAVAAQVRAFVETVDVGPAIETFKTGCTRVADAVDNVFTQVEQARAQLETQVEALSDEVDVRFKQGLAELEKRIRQTLATITGVLDREEVREVLEQARAGVEKLKGAIEQASLQTVFDLVINRTGQLEGRIQALDTSRMGTPQKMALKVGAKVIQEVNIDDVLRPELEAAFAEIMEPLRELISLLRDRVLVVEREIDQFQPGTLLRDQVEPHLRPLFARLDAFRPSQVLEPVREAVARLAELLEQLDPQRLLDQVQLAYGQLEALLKQLEPRPLVAWIEDAAGTATAELAQVRDARLDEIVETIRETISLRKLLEGTGIQEVADAEFWELLVRTLSGEQLNRVVTAVDGVEARLKAEFAGLDYTAAIAAVRAATAAAEAQTQATADLFIPAVTALRDVTAGAAARVAELERRRVALLDAGAVRPEVESVLRALELRPLQELGTSLDAAAALDAARLTPLLEAVTLVIQPRLPALRAMKETAIREAVPAIFVRQIGDPVRAFIAAVQAKLLPFAYATALVHDLLQTTLKELPARVDTAVGGVLDTLRAEVRKTITEVIETIAALRRALTATINGVYEQVRDNVEKVNPTLVLNAFGPADFAGTAAEGEPRPGLVEMARRIGAPGSDQAAALLQSRLTGAQLELIRARTGDFGRGVLDALNGALRDPAFAESLAPEAQTRLDNERRELEARLEAGKETRDAEWIAARKAWLRNAALGRQLAAARRAFATPATRREGTFRLNRVILEVHYPAALKMGLMGLHSFVVEQVGNLYPQDAVKRIDTLYVGIVAEVKRLPDRMVRAPLDEAFVEVKDKLRATFDIQGIFRVLDIKMDGMEGDLSAGLDRLSVAYEHLLGTLDQRLSA